MPAVLCCVCNITEDREGQYLKCTASAECTVCIHRSCVRLLLAGSNEKIADWRCRACSPVGSTLSLLKKDYGLVARVSLLGNIIIDQMNFNSKQVSKKIDENHETLVAKINEQEREISIMKKEVEKNKKMVIDLKAKVDGYETRLNDLEQEKLSNCIEILNVPQVPNENLSNEIAKIAKELQEEDSLKNVENFYRGRAVKNKPSPIVVKFKLAADREKWLEKRKTAKFKEWAKPFNVAASEYPTPQQSAGMKNKRDAGNGTRAINNSLPIMIVEQLTFHTRSLLYQTKSAAAAHGFRFVWTKNGRILVRKDEKSRAIIRIRDANDIITKIEMNGGPNSKVDGDPPNT